MSTQSLQQYLFNRAWAFTIGLPGQPGKSYSSFSINGQPPSPLRVVFDIDKSSASTSNKAKIEVYNFNTISRINYRKGYQIQLQAGYEGLVSTIYLGDIPQGPCGSISRRKGADIITAFECGTAERQLVYSHFDQSYPPGTNVVQILQDLANALEVSLGIVIGLKTQIFNAGFACTGSIKHSIDKLLKNQGVEWHIDNNSLQILPIGAHSGDTAIVLSNQTGPGQPGLTGLVGIPSQGDGFITFDALINPKLVPGCLVQVLSETINGFFKVRRAHFKGDTHGPSWIVSCEAVTISATQNYPQQNINGKFVVTA